MKTTVLCVGKIKESFYREALAEYGKRLGRYCKWEITEVGDIPTPEGASPAEEDRIRAREAERILDRLDKSDGLICTLEIGGKKLSSEQFADWIRRETIAGTSHITFVIGGSLGLHRSVTERSDFALSFSDMTFPHQLMRVILSEQVYRAFRIINGEPYHK